MPRLKPPVQAAIVGYGMGRHHARTISDTAGLQLAAVCDLDEKKLATAAEDFPQVQACTDVAALAKNPDVKLVVVAVPHNAHLPVTLKLLRAGKHVIVEKPMAISVRECDRMIAAAQKAGVMLSVYHNRRWDNDYLAIRDVIAQGHIGEVFHVEASMAGYSRPGPTWRSEKDTSGGLFFDWGAHFVDWVLHVTPGKVVSVTGQFQKRVWHHCTNEDHVEAYVRFDPGAVAHVQISDLASARKPKWYILGTQGAIVDDWEGKLQVHTRTRSRTATFEVAYQGHQWPKYYEGIVQHLTKNGPNPVTPQSARRVIALMECAERASKTGKQQSVPHE